MVGNVGSPMGTRPSAQTISETIELLKVVGGGSRKVRAILDEMKAAQEHNSKLFAELTKLKQDAEKAISLARDESEQARKLKLEAKAAEETLRGESAQEAARYAAQVKAKAAAEAAKITEEANALADKAMDERLKAAAKTVELEARAQEASRTVLQAEKELSELNEKIRLAKEAVKRLLES